MGMLNVMRHGALLMNMDCTGDDKNTLRKKILRETVFLLSCNTVSVWKEVAKTNLARWKLDRARLHALRHVTAENGVYQVMQLDWGDCTQRLTRLYGEVFAVLNFANAYYPGGGYQDGAAAQEENIMRRTNLHFELKPAQMNLQTRKYTDEFSRVLNAENKDNLIHMHWDKNSPDFVFRASENWEYEILAKEDFFPFAELRGAALDLRQRRLSENEIMQDCRRRIKAQLNTLIVNKIRHVVLGAFGCGVFGHNPHTVASIYVQEIRAVRSCFDVIAFAIILSSENLDAFTRTLPELGERLLCLEEQEVLAGYSNAVL
jgi:uncharacterized protein (TIGR02452 family)